MAIKIITPGLLTLVQDLGRPGYYHLGIPISGGMDRLALRCANLLVGNSESSAVFESVFMGPEIEFEETLIVAVTGAEIVPKVDGIDQSTWTAFEVKAGQKLSFDYLKEGARIYIAISGGIDVPVVLGSRSTYTLGALGGYNGRPLAANDIVKLGGVVKTVKGMVGKSIPEHLRYQPGESPTLRVLPGIYWHRVTKESQDQFFKDKWKVALEADRIGYRFQGGTPLNFVERKQPFGAGADPSNIVDGCYPYGSIQVPNGSEPIVLHRDAVSGGGYFMLGAVISADMDYIGQLQPHSEVEFVKVDMSTALEARENRKDQMQKIRSLFV